MDQFPWSVPPPSSRSFLVSFLAHFPLALLRVPRSKIAPPARSKSHHDRLPTPISRSGSVDICQDSLWHLREVIRSDRPCFPLKVVLWDNMRVMIPPSPVSSNHPVTKSTAHNQPDESVTSTKQDHSKESFFPRVKE
eukprot:scaffold25409_cov37-Attheya_sp.AAC.3